MNAQLESIAQQTLSLSGSASATIFVVTRTGALSLAAAAGVDGPALDRLVGAVQSPEHPVARTAADGHADFDVTPIAPGGPALRSHVPLIKRDGTDSVVGVLAVAHQAALTADQRRALFELADQAAEFAADERE